MKYEGRELEKGERIRILGGDLKTVLGIAKYVKDSDGIPTFEWNGGRIYGYECWWIPEKEAGEVEKEDDERRRKERIKERIRKEDKEPES